jgi:hypothetical protein
MIIEVVRTGGFAGIRRTETVDTATHPDGPRLAALAASLTPRPAPRGPVIPDGFRYTISADGRTIHCADPQVTPAQRELIEAVLHEGA